MEGEEVRMKDEGGSRSGRRRSRGGGDWREGDWKRRNVGWKRAEWRRWRRRKRGWSRGGKIKKLTYQTKPTIIKTTNKVLL